jgi:CxxC motif-containing protein (DUF1111 family)
MRLGKGLCLVVPAFLVFMVLGTPLDSGAGQAHHARQFGDPLGGLTADESARFEAGRDAFEEVEEADEGLGPTFNDRSCAACHSLPVTGGAGTQNETRFGILAGGVFTDLPGGSLLQSQAIDPACQEVVPAGAHTALRQTTPLFGLGLVDAIPDRQIAKNAQRQQFFFPQMAGRVHWVTSVSQGRLRAGRFGWKAQQATLLDFSGDAYLNEMGVTSSLFPFENAPNGDLAKLAACDAVPDPEDVPDADGLSDVDRFADFMRLLAPPPHGPPTHYRGRYNGAATFAGIGCAVCHRPAFTAVSPSAAINQRRVLAYSDFLLHDVGTGDGIAQGNARPNELRTAPLWGLSASAPYLHDGSAATVEDAILRHAGQARGARNAFARLRRADRLALLDFLGRL